MNNERFKVFSDPLDFFRRQKGLFKVTVWIFELFGGSSFSLMRLLGGRKICPYSHLLVDSLLT